MRPCTYVVTKASNDGTFQVGDRIEQLHNGKTWIQNRNIIVEAKESIEGSYGMSFVSEDEYNQSLQEEEIKDLVRTIYCIYINHPDYISSDRIPTLEDCQKFIKIDRMLDESEKLAKLTSYPWDKIVKQVGNKVNKHRKHFVTTEELVSMVEAGNTPLVQITETDDEDFPVATIFRALGVDGDGIKIDVSEFTDVNDISHEEPTGDASNYKWFHLSDQCNMFIGAKKFYLLSDNCH